MTMDNGLDNPLPISKEGLLAALDVAIQQAIAFRRLVHEIKSESKAQSPLSPPLYLISKSTDTLNEIDAHIEYLERLADNIKEDKATYYPPVARKV